MIVQGSPEWFAARLGKVTASRVADVIAKARSGSGPSASRQSYAAQLIAERLTGVATEGFSSPAMQHGTDTEPMAREAYEYQTGQFVEQVGIVPHPTITMAAASPDGLVGSDGLLEIKCPNTSTHIETLRSQKVPSKYMTQMQWQMACTGREWCDFVSFDPRMPLAMRLLPIRVLRDGLMIVSLEREVSAFLAEIEETVTELTSLYGAPLAEAA